MNETKKAQQRTITGVVSSNKMAKTLVVAVTRLKKHPKYKKYHKVTKKYYVHYDNGTYNVGDTVTFVSSRPMSKLKRWRVDMKV